MQENNQMNPIPDDEIADEDVFIDSVSDINDIDLSGLPVTEVGESATPDSKTRGDDDNVAVEKENEEFKPVDQESLIPTTPDEPVSENRSRRVFRTLFRWSAGVLIIFGLGLITGIFLFYRPATQEAKRSISVAETDLTTAQGQITELESQITALENQIDTLQPLRETNIDLLATQDDLKLHIAILDARLDVTSALLALSQDDNARARILLNNTSDTLKQIKVFLEPEQQEITTGMQQRLELVMNEIEDDPYAAQSDLDVLATNLLQLEDALISE